MREAILTAKTVEEATELALAQLGVSADDPNVNVEVLELPQRRLFKSIPAKVRVTVEEEPTPAPKKEAPAPVREKAPQKVSEKAPAPEKAFETPKKPAAEKKPEAPQEEKTAEVPQEEMLPEEPVDLSQNEKARTAVAYLSDICAKMGADAVTVTPVKQGETLILKVEGEGAGALIGHRGEVMEALGYLTSLAANRAGGDYAKISLDVNHYRSKREANLVALAKRIGAKVARTGRSHTLEPMNPYERRIIHSTISQMEGVKSESTGEGASRRVVVLSTNPRAASRGTRGERGGRSSRGGRGKGSRSPREGASRGQRTATPAREFADRPRDPGAAPMVPKRTETINDGADLPLYGKIEL